MQRKIAFGWIGSDNRSSDSSISNEVRAFAWVLRAALFLVPLTGCGEGASSVGGTVATTASPESTLAPIVTFSANPATVSPGAAATLNWSVSDAAQCVASGGWSGAKSTSGSQSTGSLSASTSYILSCSGVGGSTSRTVTVSVQAPATGTADLSWIAPTTNTDDSLLVDLAGYRIYHGLSAANLQYIGSVSAGELTYRATGLGPGTHHFSVTAVSIAGVESDRSEIATKSFP